MDHGSIYSFFILMVRVVLGFLMEGLQRTTERATAKTVNEYRLLRYEN